MKNRLSPANLVARSAALAGSLAERVSPTRPSPFLQRGSGTMSAARPVPLPLLTALTALAVAAALFAIYVYPAYAQEGSAPDKPTGLEVHIDTPAPPVPTRPRASTATVVLTWDDPEDDSITGYVILRRVRVNDQGGDFSVLVANTGSAATTYTDDKVAASLTYTYRIKAINEHGTSERSRWYHIDTPAAPEPAANSPATGSPTITGTAQVGETLTVDTSGIADEDGLEDATFGYQWLADGTPISGATATAYTPVEADEGKAITAQVNFTDDAGNDETLTSAPTDAVAAAEPTEPPAKPTGLEATATHNQVVLTWKDPNDDSITGYVILRRVRVNDQGGDFDVLAADTGMAALTYADDTVAASLTYTYRIKAINGAGTSERSRWYHIDTPAAPEPETDPADLAPANLAAALAGGQVVLTWDAPAEDADTVTGYEVLRGEGTDEPATLAADTGSTATTYTDATATTASKSYAYSVKAIRDGERSQASNEAVVQLPPAVPAGVNSAAAHDRVLLSWNDPQDGAITGYRILRADVVDGAQGEFATMIADTGSAATTYTDTTVEPEGSYVYRVQAIGPSGLSGPSPDLAVNTPPAPITVVVTPADPQAPTNLSAELTDGQVALHWDAPTQDADEVTGYEILRAEGQGELATLESDTGNVATTYTDTTVASAGASYAYRVKAIRDGERSGASNEAGALLKPNKPRTLTAPVVAHNSVTLSWRDPQDNSITGYVILRRDKAIHEEGVFEDVEDDTGSADTTYTDDTAEPNKQYVYRIKAINAAGLSEISSWVRAYTPAAPDGQPPAAPQQVLSGAGHDRVLLHWADPQDDSITGYRILRAGVVDGVQGEFAVLIEDTGSAATTYTDNTVEPETSYVYRVLAINPGGVSEPSSDVEVRTTAPVEPEEPLRTEPANVSEGGTDCPDDNATTCAVDVGGSVTGNIGTDTDEDRFAVVLEAGKRYQIDMEGQATSRGTQPNPFLEFFNVSTFIEQDNDDGVGDNARLVYTPTVAGTYYINAATGDDAQGTYTLSVIVLGANGASEADTDFPRTSATTGRVEVGASATGNISALDYDWFRVDLEAGKTYQFDLEGSPTSRGTLADTLLDNIRDSSGTEIRDTANDDIDGSSTNSRVTFTPASVGVHYLVAASALAAETGTYTLSVREVTPPSDDCPHDDTTTCEVDVGGSVTGNIETADDADWFKVELEAGTRYQIDVEGADTGRGIAADPGAILYDDRSDNFVAFDDNSGVGDNARVIYTPTAAGTHYVQVTTVGTGTYTLSVIVLGANGASEADTDFPETTATTGRVEVGASATGNIATAGDMDWFKVVLEAGKFYQIDLVGAGGGGGALEDPYLRNIRDSSGTEISETGNDDIDGTLRNYDSRVILNPTAAGAYYLVAGGAAMADTGTYTLSATEVETRTTEGDTDFPSDITTLGLVEVGGSATGEIDPRQRRRLVPCRAGV